MEISIDINELRKRKIFVATPMYGGVCTGMYTKATADLATVAAKYGIEIKFFYLFNESLVTRARNYVVHEFLKSDCTHLMFIDADVAFDPDDVLSLAALSEPGSDYEIVTGAYPKKTIAWEKVVQAVESGVAKDDPTRLEEYIGDYVFNPVGDVGEIYINTPTEVLEGGTGFMMIQRSAFEKYTEAYPELMYKPDHIRSSSFDGSNEIMAFFDCVIDPDSKRYLSEDYMFCQYARKIGIKIWLCPWIELKHTGTYTFGGSLASLAKLGASPTADISKLKKSKKEKKDDRS